MIHYNKYKSYVIKNQDKINYVICTYTNRKIKIEFLGKILFDKEYKRSSIHLDSLFTVVWAYLIIALHNEFLTYHDMPISYKKHDGVVIYTNHGIGMALVKLIGLTTLIFGIL